MDADAAAARMAGKPLYEARRGGGPNKYAYGFLLTPYMTTPNLVTDLTRWCDEQFTILGWDRHKGGFWFHNVNDAMAFKMRWM